MAVFQSGSTPETPLGSGRPRRLAEDGIRAQLGLHLGATSARTMAGKSVNAMSAVVHPAFRITAFLRQGKRPHTWEMYAHAASLASRL